MRRTWYPDIVIYSEYAHTHGNNYRKMHGIPMRRYKHIERESRKAWNRFIDNWNAYQPGYILTPNEIRRILNNERNKNEG